VPPQYRLAKPPDDEMHVYNSKDLERIFGLPASAVRSLARAGHISPVKRGGRLHYSFEDLLMMRTASALRAANISAQRINRTLQSFRAALPANVSDRRSLTALGDQIAIRQGKLLWESDSGQYVLDIGDAKGTVHVIARNDVPPPSSLHSAADLYLRGFELEETDPEGSRAAYQACLEADAEHVEARINLGRLLHQAGRLAEAERIYRGTQQAEPLIAFNLGVLLEDLDREPDAIGAYREALALDPALADAHYNLARLYERARNSKASLRHLLAYRRMTDRPGT
jgi:tetratricopeptide (TPR) repeat protein